MTYQGTRAQPARSAEKRVFAVSKIRMDAAGHVTDVLWGEVNAKSNLDVSSPVVAPVAEVVDAIHEGAQVAAVFPAQLAHLPEHMFTVVERADGSETIAFNPSGAHPSAGQAGLHDMDTLDD